MTGLARLLSQRPSATNVGESVHLLLLLYLWGSPFWVRFLRMWPFLKSNHRGSHIPSSCMAIDGCVYVASIHMNLWILCDGMDVCTDYTSIYSLIQKSLGGGKESGATLTLRQNPSQPGTQRRVEPTMLHHVGQRARHATNWAVWAPSSSQRNQTENKWDFNSAKTDS